MVKELFNRHYMITRFNGAVVAEERIDQFEHKINRLEEIDNG